MLLLNLGNIVCNKFIFIKCVNCIKLLLVGIVREVIDATTNIAFKIDDGTHSDFLVARFWLADSTVWFINDFVIL